MPMNLPPAGGLPSPLTQAPANAGAASMPQGNTGNIQAALVKVQSATKLLEEALPLIPFGSDEHNRIAKIIMDLSRGANKVMENAQLQAQSLQNAAKSVVQNAPMANMARMFSAQQGAGQAPAMPQPAEAA